MKYSFAPPFSNPSAPPLHHLEHTRDAEYHRIKFYQPHAKDKEIGSNPTAQRFLNTLVEDMSKPSWDWFTEEKSARTNCAWCNTALGTRTHCFKCNSVLQVNHFCSLKSCGIDNSFVCSACQRQNSSEITERKSFDPTSLIKPVELVDLPSEHVTAPWIPRSFQEETIRAFLTFNMHYARAPLGTGKTFMAWYRMEYGRIHQNWKRVLVVGPRVVMSTWQEELRLYSEFSPEKDDRGRNIRIPGKECPWYVMVLSDDLSIPERARMLKFLRMAKMPVIILTTYSSLRGGSPVIEQILEMAKHENGGFRFDACFLDEAAKIRYTKTQQWHGVMEIQPVCKHRYELCGIPAPQALSDYVGQYAFLHPAFFGYKGRDTFEQQFAKKNPQTKRIEGWFRPDWIHKIVDRYSTVIREEDVARNFDVLKINRYFEMSDDQKKAYDMIARLGVAQIESFVEKVKRTNCAFCGSLLDEKFVCSECSLQNDSTDEVRKVPVALEAGIILVVLRRLRQIAKNWLCGAKKKNGTEDFDWGDEVELEEEKLPPIRITPINPALEVLEQILDDEVNYPSKRQESTSESDENGAEKPAPFVIVYWHTHEGMEISSLLTQKEIKHVFLRGGISDAKLEEAKRMYNEDEIDCLLIQVSMGEGHNLQHGNTLIGYSIGDSYNAWGQCMGRQARIGQDAKTVRIINIIARGTVEQEAVMRMEKRENICTLFLKDPKLIQREEYEKYLNEGM